MPIQRSIDIDFRSESICSFLTDHGEPDYKHLEHDDRIGEIGYEDSGLRKDMPISDPEIKNITLLTSVAIDYDLVDIRTRQPVSSGRTFIIYKHDLECNIYALLLLKPGIDPESRSKIIDRFEIYDPANDQVDSVESDLVQSGVPIDNYHVLLSFGLSRLGEPKIDSSHDDAFNRQARHSEQYRVHEVSRGSETCDVPNIDLDETGRRVVVSNPNDSNEADRGLSDIGQQIGEQVDCSDLEPTSHKVATLFAYPEFRVKWKVRRIKIGRCRFGKTKVPILQKRETRKVLYAFVLSPDNVRVLLERVFIDCMKSSVLIGGLAILVTGGNFATALAAFKFTMNACLKTKVPDSVARCVIPELGIVTESGSWKSV